MKVSKEKRDEIRRSLIEAAVGLFVEKGFAETSMREVAARASVAPGTAYKYFPDRDQLLVAFFELKFADAEVATFALPGYTSFCLKERLQAFVESLLSEYLQEREFVAIIVTERLAGRHAAEYVALEPAQDERNRYGQLLVDLFHYSVFELHRIHADPNFGNYLFRADGKLARFSTSVGPITGSSACCRR